MIDVAISSCARVDILEKAVYTFLKHVKSDQGFRLVICEDKVDGPARQEEGRLWIVDNTHLFDTVVWAEKKLTYVYCFSEILKYIKSPYFFRLEDDVVFEEDIYVDEIIEFMKENSADLSQVIFRRKTGCNVSELQEIHNKLSRKTLLIPRYSIGTGVFNLEWTRKIVSHSGTDQCHETGVLTPSMKVLGATSSIMFGEKQEHALDCVGDSLGFMKGSYK